MIRIGLSDLFSKGYYMMEPEIVEPEQPQVDEPLEKPRVKKPRKPPTENQLAALAKGRELRKTKFQVVPKPDPKPVEPEPKVVEIEPKRALPRVKREKIIYYADSDEEEPYYAPPPPKRVVKARADPPPFTLHFV